MRGQGITRFFVHTATVEKFLGTSGYGADLFAAPVTIQCFADDARKLIRNKDGAEVVSESTLYTFTTNAPLFAPDSRVTIWPDGVNVLDGNENAPTPTRVIKVNVNDSGSLNLPDHVAVNLV